MKMNKILMGASLCALVLAATGCGSDGDLSDGNKSADGKVIINATASINTVGGSDSRVSLGGEKSLTPLWESGDVIAVKVDEVAAENLALNGEGRTSKGSFSGTITPKTGTKMYAYYPATAATVTSPAEVATDLTSQKGTIEDAAKASVMFATAGYSEKPRFSFENKTSILKLNLDVPSDCSYDTSNEGLYVKVIGAYSKGTLKTDGSWDNCSYSVINVTGATIVDNKILAYIVVIPGCNVSNIRILVGGKTTDKEEPYKNYITGAYTSTTAKVEANKIITISKALEVPKVNYKDSYSTNNYYKWDASGDCSTKDKQNSTKFDSPIDFTKPDYGTNAWTRQCLTYEQISIMLGNGFKWVADQSDKSYTINDQTYKSGIWMKKLVYCDIATKKTEVYTNSSFENLYNGQYFFLPAAGLCNGGKIVGAGDNGLYRSGTPDEPFYAYILSFSDGRVGVYRVSRGIGYLPLVAE